ncbi:MAG: MerR family transcriptional regulator [Pseudomonadota bacterium]
MEDVHDIGDVARRTGLTHRALRFYEARGLVQPLRSDGGRRPLWQGRTRAAERDRGASARRIPRRADRRYARSRRRSR